MDPDWPWWLSAVISVIGITVTALVAITTAKVSSQSKTIQKVEDDVKDVRRNVVNSHTESGLRDDIDGITTKLVGISTRLGDVMTLQEAFSRSLTNRTKIYESILAETMSTHIAESREEFHGILEEAVRIRREEVSKQIEEALRSILEQQRKENGE